MATIARTSHCQAMHDAGELPPQGSGTREVSTPGADASGLAPSQGRSESRSQSSRHDLGTEWTQNGVRDTRNYRSSLWAARTGDVGSRTLHETRQSHRFPIQITILNVPNCYRRVTINLGVIRECTKVPRRGRFRQWTHQCRESRSPRPTAVPPGAAAAARGSRWIINYQL